MEKRSYEFYGRSEDLDKLEKLFRHIEYLGQVGASRNLLVRIDGDGSGRINVTKCEKRIDFEKYNIEQNLYEGALVGIYDIG